MNKVINEKRLILGVDAGNYRAKVAGEYGVDTYRTAICEWFERIEEEDFGAGDDMEFELNGRKGFAGTLASYEDQFSGGAMYGDTKAHEDTLVRVLLAIYRYKERYCPGFNRFSIVVGQPLISHNNREKKRIVEMLRGEHFITVNGTKQHFYIDNVAVAAEGSGAFWSTPKPTGQRRIIDVGSGTANYATITDRRLINMETRTFNFGTETIKGGITALSRGVIQSATVLRWHRDDEIRLCGGIATELLPSLSDHFSNIDTLIPILNTHQGEEPQLPVYANAVGFYNIARNAFKEKAKAGAKESTKGVAKP